MGRLIKRRMKPKPLIQSAEVDGGKVVIAVNEMGYKVSFPLEERFERVKGLRYKGSNPLLLEKHLKGLRYNTGSKEVEKLAKKIEITLEMELDGGYMRVKREVEDAIIQFMEKDEVAKAIIVDPSKWKIMDMKAKRIELPVTTEAMNIRNTDFNKWQEFEKNLNEVLKAVKDVDEISDIKCDWIKSR